MHFDLVKRRDPQSVRTILESLPEWFGDPEAITAVEDLSQDGCLFLSVHTVGPSFQNAAYATTRDFYRRNGFIPLEEHHGLDWPGPSLILVRVLATQTPLDSLGS